MLNEMKSNNELDGLIERSVINGETQNAKLRLGILGILIVLSLLLTSNSKVTNTVTLISQAISFVLLLGESVFVLIYYRTRDKYNSILGYIVTTIDMISVTVSFVGFSLDNPFITSLTPFPWFYILYVILTSRRLSFRSTIYSGVLAGVLYASVILFTALPVYMTEWTYPDGTGQYDIMNRLILLGKDGVQIGLIIPPFAPLLKLVVICFATIACAFSSRELLRRVKESETLSLDQQILKVKFKSSISDTIDAVSDASETISSSFYNISTSTDEMITTLKSIGENTNDQNTSAQIGLDNMRDIHSAFEDIEESVSKQLSSLQNVNDKSVNITDGVKNITEISDETKKAFANLIKWTIEGKKALESSIIAINNISESSSYIMNINKKINDISENTNVLSINAGIEAANAGSAGVGFTIVANQIRELAKQTSEATKSVNIAIEEITEKIKDGVKSSQLVEEIFNNITESATYSDKKVMEINQATDSQYKAKKLMDEYIEEVISKMKKITEKISNEKDHSQNVIEGSLKVRSLAESTSAAIEQQIQAGSQILSATEDISVVIERNKNLVKQLAEHLENDLCEATKSVNIVEIS